MMRVGFSKDVHPLQEGEPFLLGGVKIEHEKGSVGYSDGDCLMHAVAESILGAVGLGDLGRFFPDDDPKYKDYDSSLILEEVINYVRSKGYHISNLDTMISLEKPKLKPYVKKIRARLASILDIDEKRISIKATTFEGLGIVGNEEAIICEAIVLVENDVFMML
jgi:2-C-methyl-D-erythritol 2,4-cyclodiphosphate synthase